MLNQLNHHFSGDEKTQKLIAMLIEKLQDHKTQSSSENEQEDYPIPEILLGIDNSYALYSDGACRGNPGPGSWGAMGQDQNGDVLFEASGVEMSTTNNVMELSGAIEALENLKLYLHK